MGVCEVDGIRVRLIDTPGLIDTNKDTYSILTEIAKVRSTIILPTGSEWRGVLGVESIPVATLPSCQDMKIVALQLHKHEYSWVVKLRNSTQVTTYTSLIIDGLGKYCGPHTASSVFIKLPHI